MLKNVIGIITVNMVAAALMYYFGFIALFAHTAMEVFIYAGVFTATSMLGSFLGSLFGRKNVIVQQNVQPNTQSHTVTA